MTIDNVLQKLESLNIDYISYDKYRIDGASELKEYNLNNDPLSLEEIWQDVWLTLIDPFLDLHDLDLIDTNLSKAGNCSLIHSTSDWLVLWNQLCEVLSIKEMLDENVLPKSFKKYQY